MGEEDDINGGMGYAPEHTFHTSHSTLSTMSTPSYEPLLKAIRRQLDGDTDLYNAYPTWFSGDDLFALRQMEGRYNSFVATPNPSSLEVEKFRAEFVRLRSLVQRLEGIQPIITESIVKATPTAAPGWFSGTLGSVASALLGTGTRARAPPLVPVVIPAEPTPVAVVVTKQRTPTPPAPVMIEKQPTLAPVVVPSQPALVSPPAQVVVPTQPVQVTPPAPIQPVFVAPPVKPVSAASLAPISAPVQSVTIEDGDDDDEDEDEDEDEEISEAELRAELEQAISQLFDDVPKQTAQPKPHIRIVRAKSLEEALAEINKDIDGIGQA